MAKKTKQTENTQSEEMVRFTVDLPLSMHLQFTILATLQRKSKAALVRIAIEQLLQGMDEASRKQLEERR